MGVDIVVSALAAIFIGLPIQLTVRKIKKLIRKSGRRHGGNCAGH